MFKTPKALAKLIVSALAAVAFALPMSQVATAAPIAQPIVQIAAKTVPAATPTPKAKKPAAQRDAKGRFIKATAAPVPAASKKPLPQRDAKGRFIKTTPLASASPASSKKTKKK
jgi:hypothetical protein